MEPLSNIRTEAAKQDAARAAAQESLQHSLPPEADTDSPIGDIELSDFLSQAVPSARSSGSVETDNGYGAHVSGAIKSTEPNWVLTYLRTSAGQLAAATSTWLSPGDQEVLMFLENTTRLHTAVETVGRKQHSAWTHIAHLRQEVPEIRASVTSVEATLTALEAQGRAQADLLQKLHAENKELRRLVDEQRVKMDVLSGQLAGIVSRARARREGPDATSGNIASGSGTA